MYQAVTLSLLGNKDHYGFLVWFVRKIKVGLFIPTTVLTPLQMLKTLFYRTKIRFKA